MAPSFSEKVYAIVRLIPPGKVASYGQIARLLGVPRAAREVGWSLRDLPAGLDVPWQRVINAQGKISFPPGSEGAGLQQAMLEDEGVTFGPDGRVDLKVYGWEGPDLGERQEALGGNAPGSEGGAQQLTLGI